jgi:hypothetical protein
MSYEINISKNGKHFFATNERSIGLDTMKLRTLYNLFLSQYPESEGYHITVTNWENKGTHVDVETLKDETYVVLTPVTYDDKFK